MSRPSNSSQQSSDEALAQLASILEPAAYPLEQLGNAIKRAKGDVAAAAEDLLLAGPKPTVTSRPSSSLSDWLGRSDKSVKKRARSEDTLKDPVQVTQQPKRPVADLSKLLKQPTTLARPKRPPQPALTLGSQKQIDAHGLPVTLLESPLSPAFASALYLVMMKESEKWESNKWYLAGKWVESPHLMSNYVRDIDGEERKGYYYSGSEMKPPFEYPQLLKDAAAMVEPVVNAALNRRKRFPLEFAGPWQANVCGANRYDGATSTVGWHADQLTYLGPYATIASLSLGTPRSFRLRETETVDSAYASGRSIRTYEVNLGHNSLILMNGGCQERYKHTVPPQKALDLFRPGWDVERQIIPSEDQKTYTSRINITFRFFREDFRPQPSIGSRGPREGTPLCKCGIPTLLRADQKAKARIRLNPSPKKRSASDKGSESSMVDDDMAYFWQCQSSGQTGDMKGCGFFRLLDMKAEGRGPCLQDTVNQVL